MKLEKIQEAIKKYHMELVVKDGQEMIKVSKPPKSAKITEELKAANVDFVAEFKRQDEERKAARVVREAEYQLKVAEYLKTADLRRCLVEYQGEDWKVEHYFATLEFVQNSDVFPSEKDVTRTFEPRHGGSEVFRRISLPHATETMKAAFKTGTAFPHGIGGAVVEVTPEQETQIIAEQIPAAEEAAKIASEEKAKKEAVAAAKKAHEDADLQAKFDQAKETGKPVVIRTYMVPCCDPREECSADNVVVYAMPDGTQKTEQHHTW